MTLPNENRPNLFFSSLASTDWRELWPLGPGTAPVAADDVDMLDVCFQRKNEK